MKNKRYLGFMLGAVLLLTGCGGEKQLVCEIDESDTLADLGTTKTEITLDYNDDGTQPQKVVMRVVVDITNEEVTDEVVDVFEETFKEVCSSEDEEFESCDTKREGKKITLEVVGDADFLNQDIGLTESTTLKKARELFEDNGYTCK